MQSINFDRGYKEYALNGDENNVIRVNVTDLNILKRFEETQEVIENVEKSFADINRPTADELAKADQTIREQLNYALGSDVCTPAFGSMNCLSPVSGGKTLIEAFIEAFIPVLQKDIQAAVNASRIQLEEKTDKYIKPVLSTPVTPVKIPEARPAVPDISSLTPEQKDAMLRELLNK